MIDTKLHQLLIQEYLQQWRFFYMADRGPTKFSLRDSREFHKDFSKECMEVYGCTIDEAFDIMVQARKIWMEEFRQNKKIK
jgi:hypothetical protein